MLIMYLFANFHIHKKIQLQKKIQQNMAKSYHIVLVDRDHMALTIVNLKINVGLKLHK